MGCANVCRKQLYEINPHEHIAEIRITGGQQILFDSRGAFLVQVEKAGIAGKISKGDWVFIPMEKITELHRTNP